MRKGNDKFINVLIVEDEIISALYLKNIIEEDNDFEVIDIAVSADMTLASIKRNRPQIIFMDIMIKGAISGAELALKISTLYDDIKIIFLTAFSDEEMREYAKDSKAVAYLLKPYISKDIKEALVLLKELDKSSKQESKDIVKLKYGFSYNLKEKTLMKNTNIIKLTPKESELINILCQNSNIILSKEEIMESMSIRDTSLRTLIYRIKKHLNYDIILNIKKVGYKIVLL